MKAHFRLFLIYFIILSQSETKAQGITLGITPSLQNIGLSQTAQFQITIIPNGGFTQQVFLNMTSTDLPSGYISSFSSNPLNSPYSGGAIFNIQPNASNTTAGNYYVVVSAGNGPVIEYDTLHLIISIVSCNWTMYSNPNSTAGSYTCMAIDHQNNIWVGGDNNGVEKFNGSVWTNYDTTNSNFPSGRVLSLQVDAQDNLWAGLDEGGLVKFDGSFWTVYNTSNSILQSNYVSRINIDTSGIVWFRSAINSCMGMYYSSFIKFDGTTFTYYNHCTTPALQITSDLTFDNNGTLLVFSKDYYTGEFTIKSFNGTTWSTFLNPAPCLMPLYGATSIQFDSQNHIWLSGGTDELQIIDNGIMTFNGTHFENWHVSSLTPYNHSVHNINCAITSSDMASQLPMPYVNNLFVDSQDRIWISNGPSTSNPQAGIIRFDGQQWEVYNTNNSSLTSNHASAFVEDSYGNIWAAFTDNKLAVTNCLPLSTESISLSSESIHLFPNPTTGKLNLTFDFPIPTEGLRIKLFNNCGKMVFHSTLNSIHNELDIHQLPSGFYFYGIESYDAAQYHGTLIKVN